MSFILFVTLLTINLEVYSNCIEKTFNIVEWIYAYYVIDFKNEMLIYCMCNTDMTVSQSCFIIVKLLHLILNNLTTSSFFILIIYAVLKELTLIWHLTVNVKLIFKLFFNKEMLSQCHNYQKHFVSISGVKMRTKASGSSGRKLSSQEEINKRLSLPADLKLPENFVEKLAVSPTLDGPLSRATRRQSLSEIGFGRMDTYTKLDKLGEVISLNLTDLVFKNQQSSS